MAEFHEQVCAALKEALQHTTERPQTTQVKNMPRRENHEQRVTHDTNAAKHFGLKFVFCIVENGQEFTTVLHERIKDRLENKQIEIHTAIRGTMATAQDFQNYLTGKPEFAASFAFLSKVCENVGLETKVKFVPINEKIDPNGSPKTDGHQKANVQTGNRPKKR